MFDRLKGWASSIKRDVHALYLASGDPRVPWYAKALALLVAAYALSPIDLIPDFIPILGYLDDLLLLPLGIALAVWMIPTDLMAEHRAAAQSAQEKPVNRTVAVLVVLIWAAAFTGAVWCGINWYMS